MMPRMRETVKRTCPMPPAGFPRFGAGLFPSADHPLLLTLGAYTLEWGDSSMPNDPIPYRYEIFDAWGRLVHEGAWYATVRAMVEDAADWIEGRAEDAILSRDWISADELELARVSPELLT
jgi:hypothetical protein